MPNGISLGCVPAFANELNLKEKKKKKEHHFMVKPLVPPPAKFCAFGAKFCMGAFGACRGGVQLIVKMELIF